MIARRTFKLKDIIDTDRSEELTCLGNSELDVFYDRYVELCHDSPEPDEEPTADQLTALSYVLKSKFAPYVNFACWGPQQAKLTYGAKFDFST